MLGLFDSGSGGLNTVRYLKELAPRIDLVYKIDREHSPYGIKSKKELIGIIEGNIDELIDRGAEKILIACCTASALHGELTDYHRAVSIPIISAVASAADTATESGKIGVLATAGTVRSHAFARALPERTVFEREAQELVGLIDGGLTDGSVTPYHEELLRRLVTPLAGRNIDTLILGCTHFPALYHSFARVCHPLGIKNVIDSAKIGAMTLSEIAEKNERKKKWQITEEEE